MKNKKMIRLYSLNADILARYKNGISSKTSSDSLKLVFDNQPAWTKRIYWNKLFELQQVGKIFSASSY